MYRSSSTPSPVSSDDVLSDDETVLEADDDDVMFYCLLCRSTTSPTPSPAYFYVVHGPCHVSSATIDENVLESVCETTKM